VLRFSTASENATIVRLADETGFAQVASFVAYGPRRTRRLRRTEQGGWR
jgi:hypothetical protein